MRLTTIRRSPFKILLPALFCFSLFSTASPEPLGVRTVSLMHLTLSQAIDLALNQNRDLKLAQLAVTDSQQKKEIARSAYFPHHQE